MDEAWFEPASEWTEVGEHRREAEKALYRAQVIMSRNEPGWSRLVAELDRVVAEATAARNKVLELAPSDAPIGVKEAS